MSHPASRRLRAPQDDGAALIDPPLTVASSLIARNRTVGEQFDRLAIFPVGFRTAARIWAIAGAATRAGIHANSSYVSRPVILSGHQPELFHPGVWLKDFVLSSIAKNVCGTGIHLTVDNDDVHSTSIRVPTGDKQNARIVEVPFDHANAEVPWECRRIIDVNLFGNFATVVRGAFAPWMAAAPYGEGMILDRLWPHVMDASDAQAEANLGNCLAKARHRFERELGLEAFELPLSLLGDDRCFIEFSEHILIRHRELHEIHNAALAEYRQVNHVRSRSHPFPDLICEGEWFEAPFWIWTIDNPRRRRVFVRNKGPSLEISDREGICLGPLNGDAVGLAIRGISLRPRALITTMYARLVLSDLFIHGIGGAKYDELTDLIIRRFFGIEPPAYVTATATFSLPIDRPNVSLEDVRASAQRIRDVRYRPEAFLRDPLVRDDADLSPRLFALAAEKRAFLDQHDLRRCSQQVFDQIDSLNHAMHDLLKPVEEFHRAQHSELIAQAKQAQLLSSREFSFVLFPSENLPARLLALSGASS